MVKSKKLLSLFLAVIMVFSALTVMASAYTVGDDIADGVNVKYTVEKIDTVPANEDTGSEEYSADNLYAVSIWMKASMGVDMLTAPVHYNKKLFAPITLVAEGMTLPYGAEMDQDTYYTDMGEGALYAYTLGDYMNNTGMYNANGGSTTNKALAKCIGLGNPNSPGVSVTAELVSPDHNLYSKYGKGLSADTGVLYFNLDVQCNAKTAYLNTIEGINYSTDWNKMFTVYFEAISDDVDGAEFGVYTADCFKVEGIFDTTGSGYYVGTASYKNAVAAANVSGNAKVEAAAAEPIVYHVKNQIQWADKDAGTVNLGIVAGFKESKIGIQFDENDTATNVTAVGAQLLINGVPADDKTERFVYETTKDGEKAYNFRIVLANVDPDNDATYTVTPYVVYNGKPIYGDAIEITDANVDSYVTKLG